MKSNAIKAVLEKFASFDKTGRALDALHAVETAEHPQEPPPENDEAAKPFFDKVPAAAHRPDLPEHAMTFDEHTGLPHILMERFPLPHEEDDDLMEADAVF